MAIKEKEREHSVASEQGGWPAGSRLMTIFWTSPG